MQSWFGAVDMVESCTNSFLLMWRVLQQMPPSLPDIPLTPLPKLHPHEQSFLPWVVNI